MAYEKLQRAGLRIGLGTDIAGGPSLSMFRQMGEALNSAGVLSPEGALYLATMGGAQVLGLADRIGNFERGKDADFIVVDYRKTDPLSGSGSYNEPQHILSRLCYNGDAYCVKEVYSSGRRLM
jgi:guanine deaminase